MSAQRLPGKPLLEINNIPVISHVVKRGQEANIGEVVVCAEDEANITAVKKNGGKAILTKPNHPSGTDRVYEAYIKELKNNVDLIINLQGDMPNIKPHSISKLEKLMRSNDCDIGTLASDIKDKHDIINPNVVKVNTEAT